MPRPPVCPSPARTCAACAAHTLAPHLRVAGSPGAQGLIPTTDRYGVALDDLVRCRACGHGQLAHPPAVAQLDGAYAAAASEDYLREEAGQRATARALLARVERHVERGALLDAGCWLGFLLDEARTRGWETVGLEPSGYASAYARDELRLDVRRATLADADLGARRFDAVMLADVLEHLPDPLAALARIERLLTPDGVVCLVLPDAGSRVARALGARWWSIIPTHVHQFTRASLAALLARAGLAALELDTAPKAFTVRYYLERLGGYSRGAADALVAAAARLGVAERLWAPDFGDRMLVVARRREDSHVDPPVVGGRARAWSPR